MATPKRTINKPLGILQKFRYVGLNQKEKEEAGRPRETPLWWGQPCCFRPLGNRTPEGRIVFRLIEDHMRYPQDKILLLFSHQD